MREEARLQKWCVTWLRERGYLVVGSASGAQFSRAWFTWKWLTGQGVEAGVPDLLILEVGADQRTPGLAVELKTGRRMLTAQQSAGGANGHATRAGAATSCAPKMSLWLCCTTTYI